MNERLYQLYRKNKISDVDVRVLYGPTGSFDSLVRRNKASILTDADIIKAVKGQYHRKY